MDQFAWQGVSRQRSRTAAWRSASEPGRSETAMIVVPHTWSGMPSTAPRHHDRPPNAAPLLDVCKINLVTAGDHHVVRPTQDDQPPSVEVAPILGAKSAVRNSLSGEIGAQPITREEGRTSDQDPTVVREVDSDALQRLSVVDTQPPQVSLMPYVVDSDPCGSGPLTRPTSVGPPPTRTVLKLVKAAVTSP